MFVMKFNKEVDWRSCNSVVLLTTSLMPPHSPCFYIQLKMKLSCGGKSPTSWGVDDGQNTSLNKFGLWNIPSSHLSWKPTFYFRTVLARRPWLTLTVKLCRKPSVLQFVYQNYHTSAAVCMKSLGQLCFCLIFIHCYLNSIAQGSCTRMLVNTGAETWVCFKKVPGFLIWIVLTHNWSIYTRNVATF